MEKNKADETVQTNANEEPYKKLLIVYFISFLFAAIKNPTPIITIGSNKV